MPLKLHLNTVKQKCQENIYLNTILFQKHLT